MEKVQRMSAQRHGPTNMTRSTPIGGCAHIFAAFLGFMPIVGIFIVICAYY